ncbi:predicted transporter [Halarchaeum acidiphilum MH1-52-1]|uniref:Predicted transporter n=1 Tax=Halarchaeum acidiphilum MH1-52-1 TaxID=1261545 RepID=U2YTF1_9EURY|nr:AEC family transporter [Halarchaeum acidiphilum]GAD52290.1 predicted transporter [Halarchaeum acidiphilum MH1-52-1]
MTLFGAFTSAILPIVAIAAVGYVLGRATDVSVGPLNTVALNFFLPALVFHGIATTSLSGSAVVSLVVAVLAYALVIMALAYVAGRALDVPDSLLSGIVLASAFPNSGFVGIPLTSFVFGDLGKTTATLFLTTQSVLLYTLGVYVVSAGKDDAAGATSALREVFRLPLVYAVAAAAIVRLLGLTPPADGTFMTTVNTVGSASVPLMLTVVGIQLADVDLGHLRPTALPTALKLVVAPVVGAAIAIVIGFANPDVANIFVLECATPAAVTPLALTIAYSDGDPDTAFDTAEYMSTVIFVTTVLSVVVLTGLVAAIQSGFVF